jgi:hypothetical protein
MTAALSRTGSDGCQQNDFFSHQIQQSKGWSAKALPVRYSIQVVCGMFRWLFFIWAFWQLILPLQQVSRESPHTNSHEIQRLSGYRSFNAGSTGGSEV